MNRKLLSPLFTFLFIGQAFGQLSGAYTIDAGFATGGSNFASFTAAASALNTQGISGPVTLTVAAGSGPYNEQVAFGKIAGSNATNRIVLNGNGETLQFTPVSPNQHILRLAGTDYFSLKNLTIVDLATTAGIGIMLSDTASYDSILNCTVNLGLLAYTGATNTAAIAVTNFSSNPIAQGYNASHVVIANNTLIGGYYGIAVSGNPGSGVAPYDMIPDIQLLNNDIQDFQFAGVYGAYVEGLSVQYNNFTRPLYSGNTPGSGIFLISANYGALISENRIHDTHTAGPSGQFTGLNLNGFGSSSAINLVKNNVIYAINVPTAILYGIRVNNNGQYFDLYHNTIDLSNSGATAGNTFGINCSGTSDNIQIRNNIISVTRNTNAVGNRSGIFIQGTPVVSSDYNVIFVSGVVGNSYIGQYNGTTYATLPTWQTANGGTFDQSSLEMDPGFASPGTGDFTPTGSGIDGLCMPVGVATDILGQLRDPVAPDPGAFEVFLLPEVQVTLTAQPSPGSVFLQWFSSSETQVQGYALSRTQQGTTTPLILTEAGSNSYTFTDNTFIPGQPITYRLLWTDTEGRYHPGAVTEVSTTLPPFRLTRFSLDPLQIAWQTAAGGPYEVRVYDLSGKLLVREFTADPHLEAATTHWPGGLYVLEIRAGGEVMRRWKGVK